MALSDRFSRLRASAPAPAGGADLNKRLLTRLAPRRTPSWRQLRYLPTVLSRAERRLAVGLLVAVFAAAAVMGVRVWQLHVVSVPARGGEYIEGLVGAPTYINPLFAGANEVDLDLTRLVYSGLMRTTPEGTVVPDLAESVEMSEDGKTVTAVLRNDLRFHDGQTLTTDDILFTFEAIQNPAYKSAVAASFKGVTVAAPDERTVTFTLSEPYAPFLTALTVGILPAHLWRDVPPTSANLAEFNLKPVGSGPYKFKAFSRDRVGTIRSYTFERFTGNGGGDGPFIGRIAFRFFADFDAAVEAYRSRQIDGLGFAPTTLRDRLRGRHDANEFPLALPQYTALFFNQKRVEALKDPQVREALTVSLDRERIIADALAGAGELVDGPVFPGFAGVTSTPARTAFDPDKAAQLLEKAGWALPEGGGPRVKTTKDSRGRVTATTTLALTIVTAERDETSMAAKAVADTWRALGLDVKVEEVPASRMQRDVLRPHAYDVLLYGQILGRDPDPLPFWHSGHAVEGGFNLALYANRNADALLEAARKEQDAEKRGMLYTQFANLVVAERAAAFLYRPVYPYFVTTAVKGITADEIAVPADRFAGVADWYIKTRKGWR